MKTKVFIVDDHPFTRAGVRGLLETNNAIDIIGEAEDGIDAVKSVIDKQPDIVVMDISMPLLSGIEATRQILNKFPEIKIIALSINKGEVFVKKMLDAGAVGYLLKDEAPEELLNAIQKVEKGDVFLSSGVTRAALSKTLYSEELTNISILQSKLKRPPVAFDYVIRTNIIQELENNIIYPLSIVSAGAGYGKSAVVSQWLEQSSSLYSWLSLDEEHNDFRTFLYYLIAAIEKIFPGLVENTRNLVSAPNLPPDKEISNSLINELCNIDQDFILVLDDYHLIKEKRIHDLLDEWLRFPPPSVHLCIATRRDPPLKIKSLRLSGRMTEIRMDKLAFSYEEIAEFFKQVMPVDLNDESTKILHNKTEGWIIGIRLFTMLIKSTDELKKILQSIDVGVLPLTDYLLAEVLSIQSKHIQDQLLATSVMNRFSAELIEEILEPTGENILIGTRGTGFIQWMKKSNLFVIQLDNEQKWFRYHHMFQDFLQNQLKKRGNLQYIKEIHIKASLWFERNDLIEESIEHAMKAGDTDRAVEIINKNWETVSDSDNFLTVDKWLSYLPEEAIHSSVSLLFALFYNIFKRDRLEEFPLVLGLIQQSKGHLSKSEKGYLAFIKSMVYYYSGEGEKSFAESEKALKQIPEEYSSFRRDARTFWHISMLMIGKREQGLKAIKNLAKKFLVIGDTVQLGGARHNIGFSALLNADLPQLRTATEEMLKTPDLSKYMMGFYMLNLQYISWFSGDLEGVVRESEGVIELKYEFTSRFVIDCYVMKALALLELNNLDFANKALTDAIEFAEFTKDPYNLSVALSGKARFQLKQGQMEYAIEWLDKTEQIGRAHV